MVSGLLLICNCGLNVASNENNTCLVIYNTVYYQITTFRWTYPRVRYQTQESSEFTAEIKKI